MVRNSDPCTKLTKLDIIQDSPRATVERLRRTTATLATSQQH